MGKYAIFLDMDGTFLGTDGQLIEENINTVNEYMKKGHKFFICSGRPRASIHDYIIDALPWNGIISSAGSEILIDGVEIKRDEISKETAFFLADLFLKENVWLVLGNGKDGICMNIEPRVNWKRVNSMEELKEVYEYTTKIDHGPISDETKEKIVRELSHELSFFYYDTYVENIKTAIPRQPQ